MNASHWDLPKLIVGLACVIVAIALLLFAESDSTTAGAVVFAVLGMASIVTSRKKQ